MNGYKNNNQKKKNYIKFFIINTTLRDGVGLKIYYFVYIIYREKGKKFYIHFLINGKKKMAIVFCGMDYRAYLTLLRDFFLFYFFGAINFLIYFRV